MPGDVGRSADPSDAVLTEALTALKRRGSNLLVVGAVTGEATARACRRMLGDADPSERHRLLVFTDADGSRAAERVHGGEGCAHTDSVTLIDHAAASRSTVATAPTVSGSAPTETTDSPSLADAEPAPEVDHEVDATDLVELGQTVTAALDAIEADAGSLSPSELRMCMDSLLPLLEANGTESVFRFLHVLTGTVRRKRGMAHFHLPVDPSAEEVHLFAPLFDAVVELRTEDGDTQQRWHVHDADISTDWLAV